MKSAGIVRESALFRYALAFALMVSPSGAEAFKPLFNGTSLDGWEGDPAIWRV